MGLGRVLLNQMVGTFWGGIVTEWKGSGLLVLVDDDLCLFLEIESDNSKI